MIIINGNPCKLSLSNFSSMLSPIFFVHKVMNTFYWEMIVVFFFILCNEGCSRIHHHQISSSSSSWLYSTMDESASAMSMNYRYIFFIIIMIIIPYQIFGLIHHALFIVASSPTNHSWLDWLSSCFCFDMHNKARAIIKLASRAMTGKSPSTGGDTNTSDQEDDDTGISLQKYHYQKMPAVHSQMTSPTPTPTPTTMLSMKRSLQRFLQKRRHRISATSPYSVQ